MAALNAYYGIRITLSDTNAHQLLPLLIAIDSTLAGILQNVGQLALQGDAANSSNLVRVGDANVSATRYGYQLAAGIQRVYQKEGMSVPLGAIYVQASAATSYLNVEIIP